MRNFENYKKLYDWKKPKNRNWMDNEITKAPIWCSVDLRDGNQALPNPMTLQEKVEFFDYLVKIGFKEIEIGFPAASDTEFEFARYLIDNKKIPDDVKIQVITQAREKIIERTFEAVKDAKNVIIHMYSSISRIQREVVFNKTKEEVKNIAIDGAKFMLEQIKKYPNTNWYFEYSPESFTNTEMDYAMDVINGVLNVWKKHNTKPIIDLTATVECSTPNIFADQVAYVIENINNRDNVIVSVHTHNDRGTGVAASELAILAGAERVEGTLFGNGERTGNVDILNLAMNMYVLGIDPKIDFSHMNMAKEIYEKYTKMKVGVRHPYAGELVFTAFSGSHQDAISKGLKAKNENNEKYWEVPYLPINPADINRQYEPIIRINSQSGKGGVVFILNNEFGYNIPTEMKQEVGYFIKYISDKAQRELSNKEIYNEFIKEYQNREDEVKLVSYNVKNKNDGTRITIELNIGDEIIEKSAIGNGPIDATINILKNMGYKFEFKNYIQEALKDKKEKSDVITYINITANEKNIWAVGKDEDVLQSGLLAVISAINRI